MRDNHAPVNSAAVEHISTSRVNIHSYSMLSSQLMKHSFIRAFISHEVSTMPGNFPPLQQLSALKNVCFLLPFGMSVVMSCLVMCATETTTILILPPKTKIPSPRCT